MVDKFAVEEVTKILVDEYLGIGSTPQTALESLANDMASNRLDVEMLECSDSELIISLGNLLKKICEDGNTKQPHNADKWQRQVLDEYNNPTEEDWWFAIR